MTHEIVIRLKIPQLTRRQRSLGIVAAIVLGSAALVYAAVPNTFSTGDTLSASKVNDNFSALQAQITTPSLATREPSAFHAGVSAPFSVTGSQYVVFDHVDFDIANEFDSSTGTFTAKHAGIYLVTCNLFFTLDGTPATFGLIIYKNSQIATTIVDTQSGTSTSDLGGLSPTAIATVQLAAGDTLRCAGGDETGTTRALDTNDVARNTFSATRVY